MPDPAKSSKHVLDPIDRASEVLFGLIMVLTYTGSLSVTQAGRDDVRVMLVGALGCNLAWGIIDAILLRHGMRSPRSAATSRPSSPCAPPPTRSRPSASSRTRCRRCVASIVQPEELESMRLRLVQLPEPAPQARLGLDDWLGAAAVFLLVFVSTFPVVIPFIVMDARGASPARVERHRHRAVVPGRLQLRTPDELSPGMAGLLDGGARCRAGRA